MRFTFEVPGKPIGQGRLSRTRYGGMRHANAKTLLPWRETVGWSAKAECPKHWDTTGPMALEAVFWLPRPAHHSLVRKTGPTLRDNAPWWPINQRTGDLDHYIRAIGDALTEAGIWGDDSQVVQLLTEKRYDDDGPGHLTCTITRLTERRGTE